MTADYGFEWGPMAVTRIASFEPRKGQRVHVLGIKTERADLQITVTRTGKVRVHMDGVELSARD